MTSNSSCQLISRAFAIFFLKKKRRERDITLIVSHVEASKVSRLSGEIEYTDRADLLRKKRGKGDKTACGPPDADE